MGVICSPDGDNFKVCIYFFSSSDVTSSSFLAPGSSQLFGENIFSQDLNCGVAQSKYCHILKLFVCKELNYSEFTHIYGLVLFKDIHILTDQSNLALRVDEVPLFQDIKDLPCSSEMDVTVINEGISTPIDLSFFAKWQQCYVGTILDRDAQFASAMDTVSYSMKIQVILLVQMMPPHTVAFEKTVMIPTSSFNRSAATLYTLECWRVLMKVFSMFRKRPKGFDESIQFYVVDAIKFLEFLTLRGYHEVSNLLTKFVITVIGRYLRKPEKMNETSQTWIQSRVMLRIVCQTPTNFDTVLEIIVAVDEMKSELVPRHLPLITSILICGTIVSRGDYIEQFIVAGMV
uniref:DUF4704 domain-containing protein n=1 Tax=Angiostrongylus cantonensis TaxID=6313 RepID=A0A0K0CZF6_ANGCA